MFALVTCAVLLASSCAAWPDEPDVPDSQFFNTGKRIAAPATVKEGFAHLESILGAYDASRQKCWTFRENTERKTISEKDKTPVLITVKSSKVVSNPYHLGQGFAYDIIGNSDRAVYDLTDAGKTLTKTQTNGYSLRAVFRLNHSGNWHFDTMTTSTATQDFALQPSTRGSVLWFENGFALVGTTGLDNLYAPGGKFAECIGHSTDYTWKESGTLYAGWTSRFYELAKDPSGNLLHVPDFTRPLNKTSRDKQKADAQVSNVAASVP